jgi:hypothetical protein
MWLLAQDGRSACGLLYLTAVWDDRREQEHCQDDVDIQSVSSVWSSGRDMGYNHARLEVDAVVYAILKAEGR